VLRHRHRSQHDPMTIVLCVVIAAVLAYCALVPVDHGSKALADAAYKELKRKHMDTELRILLRGHGLLDFTTEVPEGDGMEQVVVNYYDDEACDIAETFYIQRGLGADAINLIADMLSGHSEWKDTYQVLCYGYTGDEPFANLIHKREAVGK
jgi:hypothetical protein